MERKNKRKPAYDTPVVIALDELNRSFGVACNAGSNAGGVCKNGALAAKNNCFSGANAKTCTVGGAVTG